MANDAHKLHFLSYSSEYRNCLFMHGWGDLCMRDSNFCLVQAFYIHGWGDLDSNFCLVQAFYMHGWGDLDSNFCLVQAFFMHGWGDVDSNSCLVQAFLESHHLKSCCKLSNLFLLADLTCHCINYDVWILTPAGWDRSRINHHLFG